MAWWWWAVIAASAGGVGAVTQYGFAGCIRCVVAAAAAQSAPVGEVSRFGRQRTWVTFLALVWALRVALDDRYDACLARVLLDFVACCEIAGGELVLPSVGAE